MLTNLHLMCAASSLFVPFCGSGEKLMNLALVNRFKVAVVRRLQDWVGCVFSNILGYSLCDPFLDADCCKGEDVLSVGFILGVAVGSDSWFDGVGADEIGSRF